MGLILDLKIAIIGAGAALSNAVASPEKVLCGIVMPAAWTAAPLTFQASPDDGATWYDLRDDAGNEITVTGAAAGLYLAVDPGNFAGITHLKVRSGPAALPVNQVAAAAILTVWRKFYAIR
jgi:hypothetical protein